MSKREHDNLYLYDKQYLKTKICLGSFKDHLKKIKKLKFWDIGCAMALLYFF